MLWISSLPIALLFLLLLPCFLAQDGGENEQSRDIISVWEGDSFSITCSMNGSENQVGMYLKDIRRNRNVIYVPYQKSSNIFPALANRLNYSKEGQDHRITLHSAQESDSNIYLCYEIVKINDHHKNLHGKKTIVVVKAKTSGALKQSPLYANPGQGQSISITCELKSSPEDEGIYLLRTHVQPGEVLYVSHRNVSRASPAFKNRWEYSKEGKSVVITLQNLQQNDSDNYVCAEEVKDSPLLSASGTMVLVKEWEQAYSQACKKSSWGLYGLIIVVVLLFCALVCCTLYHVDLKKYFQKKTPNIVYEDMSYSSRRNTMVRNDTYSRGN
ncbi:CD7 protein, partial [Atrichornis clamosus]|nr:CD7 protein [Atrichornis clamosus]